MHLRFFFLSLSLSSSQPSTNSTKFPLSPFVPPSKQSINHKSQINHNKIKSTINHQSTQITALTHMQPQPQIYQPINRSSICHCNTHSLNHMQPKSQANLQPTIANKPKTTIEQINPNLPPQKSTQSNLQSMN